jgi:archaellum component FlaC
MRAGAEETHRLLLDLRQVSTGLSQALEDLTSEVSVSGDQQRSLFTAVTSLERLVATGIQSDHGVTRQLTEAAQTLADAADKSLAGAEAAAQAGRIASEAVRGIAEISSALAASQTRVESALANETEANSRLADTLRNSITGVGATAKTLSDIQMTLGGLRNEFVRIGDISQEHSHALSRLMTEQSAIATNLGQVARDMSAVGIANSQRQREVNEDFSAMIKRLDTIVSYMARGAGAPTLEPPSAPAGVARSLLPNAPDLIAEPEETPSGSRRGLFSRRDS